MLDFIPQDHAEEVDEHRGAFVVEPLDRGFGYTFGNAFGACCCRRSRAPQSHP